MISLLDKFPDGYPLGRPKYLAKEQHMWQRRLALAGAIAITAALALSACSGPSDAQTTDGVRGDKLSVQFTGVPISLNPALAGGGGSVVFTTLAYDPLIYLSGDGKLVPDLATEWKFRDDENTQLELIIRKGVTFQDGAQLDAHAVANSMNYFMEAGGGQVGSVGPIDTITAEDDDTVLITYKTSFPAAPTRLTQANQLGLIIGPEALKNPESLLTTMDGTGPYTYNPDTSVAESTYTYDRWDGYWNPDAQKYEQISVQVIGDPNAVISAATTGQVDFAAGGADTADAAASAGLSTISAPYFNYGLIILDRKGEIVPALADEKVRQAMGYAVDRAAIVAARGGDEFASAIDQLTADGEQGHDDGIGFDHDMQKAKSLMAESDYPDGFSMTLLSESPLDNQSLITQTAIAHLKEIGVKVTLDVASAIPDFIQKAGSKKYPAIVWPIVGDTASDYAQTFTGQGFTNAFGVADHDLDDLVAQAIVATGDEKEALEKQVSARSNELAWFLPLIATKNVYYVSPHVAGVQISPLNPNPIPVAPSADLAWRPAQ
ncbi:ABC transporter substrate-binding protein [Microbacterium protaetiae]|uniref:ABC transporter substrate-binding protein n=1 Tax=Microbacterium protaetiae TaxID=2509458 RepID=A0A4P6EEU0_9MICO|nr:ABC transporter substrate-binding protein [Microbacterium protaetiae]QAY60296.1 ABC transporter substrate-binding protein [Microbacterium protaetiae]